MELKKKTALHNSLEKIGRYNKCPSRISSCSVVDPDVGTISHPTFIPKKLGIPKGWRMENHPPPDSATTDVKYD